MEHRGGGPEQLEPVELRAGGQGQGRGRRVGARQRGFQVRRRIVQGRVRRPQLRSEERWWPAEPVGRGIVQRQRPVEPVEHRARIDRSPQAQPVEPVELHPDHRQVEQPVDLRADPGPVPRKSSFRQNQPEQISRRLQLLVHPKLMGHVT